MKKVTLIGILGAAAFALIGKPPEPAPVIAHEWGTFTSVALDTGAPAQWAPWSGPADLPCFVHWSSTQLKFELPGLVRMETPVIYFYAQQPTTLSVKVDFPKGLVTEWYPEATPVRPGYELKAPAPITAERGGIIWDKVEVLPGSDLVFPFEKKASHYFAARATDAAPVRSGKEQEKLLFYRGVGSFAPPLWVRYPGDGKLELRNTSKDMIPLAIAFENQNGAIGYRIVRDLKGEASIDPPKMGGDISTLHKELARALVAAGLYEKEAAAMIETWRDSWFEPGTRVFYIMPGADVDAVLPLTISPAPSKVARVFVGRVEVLSPWTEQQIRDANQRQDVAALKNFGRFLQPFAAQLRLTGTSTIEHVRRDLENMAYNGLNCR
jgi:hypothetical protein